MIYESVDDALFEKDEKFKTTRLKNPNHNIEKYNVYGFMPRVQHDDIPNPTPEQCHDTYEDEVTVDDHQEKTNNSDDTHDSESRTKQFNDYMRRRLDKIDRNVYELKSELKDFKETVVGFIDTFSKRPNKDSPTRRSHALFNMFILANEHASDDYGVYTDVGNQNFYTPTSLYSFHGDVSRESVQVFTEVPPGVSKFGRTYIPLSLIVTFI
ncbi:hypothetical protein CUMW_115080 [Citrus unshiu]|nr:hypothetical protein CUMW_115080 [Citrus unshiu]